MQHLSSSRSSPRKYIFLSFSPPTSPCWFSSYSLLSVALGGKLSFSTLLCDRAQTQTRLFLCNCLKMCIAVAEQARSKTPHPRTKYPLMAVVRSQHSCQIKTSLCVDFSLSESQPLADAGQSREEKKNLCEIPRSNTTLLLTCISVKK